MNLSNQHLTMNTELNNDLRSQNSLKPKKSCKISNIKLTQVINSNDLQNQPETSEQDFLWEIVTL